MNRLNNTSARVEKARALMRSHNVGGLLLVNLGDGKGSNIRYLSGFTGSTSVCLLTPEAKVLKTDYRYQLQARQESAGWDVRWEGGYLINELSDLIKEFVPKRLGILGGEITLEKANEFRVGIPEVEFVALPNIVREIRAVKDIEEVSTIRKAVRLMEEVLQELWGMVQPGVTTDCDLATALKIKLIQRGSGVSFAPIILSGSDSAFIHGDPLKLRKERELNGISPAEKVIQRGDIIQFDVGCLVDGYASDISRAVVVGRATDEQKKVHTALLEVIRATAAYYRKDVLAKKAQEEADRILKMRGFGEKLAHGLGHGIGLEVHELPNTSKSQNHIFQAGNIVSLEPGIYQEGFGGMRIERDVLVTEGDPEFLDELPTDLIELQ